MKPITGCSDALWRKIFYFAETDRYTNPTVLILQHILSHSVARLPQSGILWIFKVIWSCWRKWTISCINFSHLICCIILFVVLQHAFLYMKFAIGSIHWPPKLEVYLLNYTVQQQHADPQVQGTKNFSSTTGGLASRSIPWLPFLQSQKIFCFAELEQT